MLSWFRKKMKVIMITVAVLFAASMFYGLGYRGLKGVGEVGGKGGPIAKVNGMAISPLRFREMTNRIIQNFGDRISPQDLPLVMNIALGQAVDFTLLLGEARNKVRVSGREIDAAINNIMQQQKISSKKDLENALKRTGLTMGKFRDLLKEEMMVQKLSMKLREEVRVTPDDLREVRARHILLTSEAEAKLVLSQLAAGEKFEALAKKYSKDPGSAALGGDLGYFASGMMVEPFDKAVFSLKVGQRSGIVKTPFGFHIIELTDSRLRKFPGDEKEAEKTALREKQEKAFRRWYSEIKSKAKVDIIDPELRGHDFRFKGKLAEAAEAYRQAIAQNPANPYLHVFLGDVLMASGQKELAFPEYENAVRIEGGNPELYIILGRAYDSARQRELATAQFKKASLVAGDNKAFHEKLLQIFQAMKRPAEIAQEKREISRIEKKEAFEKQLSGEK
jgi:parvulin-like peptidyl-prolyl isomerase